MSIKLIVRSLKKIAHKNCVVEAFIFVGYILFACLNYVLFFAFGLKGTKANKVVFINMKGSRYGDNPMYISDKLLEMDKKVDVVWLLDSSVDAHLPDGIRRVDYNYINRIKELATAKVWVDSNLKDLGTRKKKDQLYFQTWHGSYGLKRLGLDGNNDISLIDRVVYPYNAKITDVMISNSKMTTGIYKRAFKYSGEMLETGNPKNDLFLKKNDIYHSVRTEFGIAENTKLAIYAPTYRNDFGTDFLTIDYERLVDSLENRFGGKWKLFLRLHPQNLKEAESLPSSDRIVNASRYSIMQDLLVAADALITDYSSCMFDYITNPRPCFIYAPDLELYEADRGCYFKMEELPFPLARNNDELERCILEFNQTDYNKKISELHEFVGLAETGEASSYAAKLIMNYIG